MLGNFERNDYHDGIFWESLCVYRGKVNRIYLQIKKAFNMQNLTSENQSLT